MTQAFVDTNVLVRHLTGDPPDVAAAATRYLADATALVLLDLIVAELCCVLESVYEVPRTALATSLRSLLAMSSVSVIDPELLHRAIEIYEYDQLDFAEACVVATAERSGVAAVASFDRSIDRVGTVRRIEPA